MIKVQEPRPGLPAIEELTRRGVNVNVTLLFADRALRAGDRRLPARTDARAAAASRSTRSHRSPRSSSRGSTPRSTPAARRLAAARSVAIANARVAYQRYLRQFAGPDAGALRALGARTAATAVGQHRHQGSGLLRRALRRRARSAPT